MRKEGGYAGIFHCDQGNRQILWRREEDGDGDQALQQGCGQLRPQVGDRQYPRIHAISFAWLSNFWEAVQRRFLKGSAYLLKNENRPFFSYVAALISPAV